MKIIILTLALNIAICSLLTAQICPLYNTVIAPSPTSAFYHQYGNYTPSLSTGTIDISIPLYDIKVGDYTLPLWLRYQTSGIKVAEDPYPCGYGWKFLPGLRVVRTIMGRPDLDGIFYKMNKDNKDCEPSFEYHKIAVYQYPTGEYPDIPYNERIDTQHDIFTVHLADDNCTFLIVDNEIKTIGNNLEITPIDGWGSELEGFRVVDEKGIKYFFGNTVEKIEGNVTAWMLDSVVLPGNNNVIKFTWQYYKHVKAQHYVAGIDEIRDSFPYDYNGNIMNIFGSGMGYANDQGTYHEVCHLTRITFPGVQSLLIIKPPTTLF